MPVITVHPQNQIASPGTNVFFSVSATSASNFQWQFNGTNILGATNATLQITNVQGANAGYYLALAINSHGWVPSDMAYLSVVNSSNPGAIPLSNMGGSQALSQADFQPINNGTAWSVAGPTIEHMQRVGPPTAVANGYFNGSNRSIPTVSPGDFVYYRVDIVYPSTFGTYTQQSTVVKIVAGNSFPIPSAPQANVKFPIYIEWPDPWVTSHPSTNQIRVPGETIRLTNNYLAYRKPEDPVIQWRKNGNPIVGATNFVQTSGGLEGGSYRTVLTITNAQAFDAGVYDVMVLGHNWIVQPKIFIAFQTATNSGVFVLPGISGSNFVSSFNGLPGRNYMLQKSPDFNTWSNLWVISNSTGSITVSNVSPSAGTQFYRTLLLP